MKLTLTGKELRAIGFPEGPVISVAMQVMHKHFRHASKEEALEKLREVLSAPGEYFADPVFSPIAAKLQPPRRENAEISLRSTGIGFNVFGAEQIEQGALKQMETAAKLPVAVAAALMPDAHQGYGLPIGGVLATENAVIPYGVGVDIGCRMCLSIFDIDAGELSGRQDQFTRVLDESTLFGSGAQFSRPSEHGVMDNRLFSELSLLKGLQGRAWKQLGSSGSGNHFVEFGVVEVEAADPVLGVDAGSYLGLLSHSGSRALGANIANHYTRVATAKRRLPKEAQHLAWLSLDEEEGMEYWLAMNLAGDYASACHRVIHAKIAGALGRQPLKMVENHHNFAWKEWYEGREVIVHRKGATPAAKDVLGIIPGSMTTPGYIVKGKGEPAAIGSAAHGAGRKMSRTQAIATISRKSLEDELKRHGVRLLGGGTDEAPFAYKDIRVVMAAQQALVTTVGRFVPAIVKMCGDPPRAWGKKKSSGVEGE